MKGQQRPQWIRLDAGSEVCNLFEALDHGANLFDRVSRLWPSFGFHHYQLRIEVFGLQTAAGVAAELPYKQLLSFIVPNIIITLMPPGAVGRSQFLPAISGIDGATKLVGIDKGFDHHHRMTIASQPIAA